MSNRFFSVQQKGARSFYASAPLGCVPDRYFYMLLCGKRRFVVVPAPDCIERYGQCHSGEQEHTRPKRDIRVVARLRGEGAPWVNPAGHAAGGDALHKPVLLNEAVEHGGNLGAGGGALGVKNTVALAVHQTAADSPFHGVLRPVGNLVGVGKAG